MGGRAFRLLVVLIACTTAGLGQKVPSNVTIGQPKVWDYSRVYPLMDGLFQDVSSIQVPALSINPNTANASNLDALQQVFQLYVQYSQLNAIQNGAAASGFAANGAVAAFQNQLVARESQLLQMQLAAQQQAGSAQRVVDNLPSDASNDQKTAAQTSLKTAQDSLASVTQQLSDVKSLIASVPSSTFSQTAPSLPSSPPTLPSISTPGGSNFAPSLPATKQMDNQVGLLWERLARLVGAMVQPDNFYAAHLYLIEFDTGVTSSGQKGKLLNVTYDAQCDSGGTPVVMDLYPRISAVNITDEKYRENRIGIGAILSWMGLGLNGGYNRDHLKITQLFGQSAYITGYGVGTEVFGWSFGKMLGDDYVSPGIRNTFALLAVPNGCTNPKVFLRAASWDKAIIPNPPAPASRTHGHLDLLPNPAGVNCNQCVANISYNPIEYDPASAATKPPIIMMTVRLNSTTSLDQQQSIAVDGTYLRRARDTFGRATPGGGGSGGLLEASALDANTWLPVSANSFIMNLDASKFAYRFPQINLQSPSGPIDLNSNLDNAVVVVGGRTLHCVPNCTGTMPALGYPRPSYKHLAVARLTGNDASGSADRILLTISDPTSTASSGVTVPSTGVPDFQLVSDSAADQWGTAARVWVITADGSANVLSNCIPSGSRLVCGPSPQTLRAQDIRVEVLDLGHATAPIRAWGEAPACVGLNECRRPLIRDWSRPQWNIPNGSDAWTFIVNFENVSQGDQAVLNGVPPAAIDCNNDPCSATFAIQRSAFTSITNSTQLTVTRAGAPIGKFRILNLAANISPLVFKVNDDQTQFSGQNLVFKAIQVNDSGQTLNLDCTPAADFCRVKDTYGKDSGILYFVAGTNQHVPVNLAGDKGVTPVVHTVKAEKPSTTSVANQLTLPKAELVERVLPMYAQESHQ